jgi:hypothetical protein
MSDDSNGTGSGPLSWRDVYQAVKDSEQRITALIQSSVGPISKASEDHERRLRVLEEVGSHGSRQNRENIAVLRTQVAANAEAIQGFIDQGKGVFGTFRVVRVIVVTVVLTASSFAAVLTALAAAHIIGT